MNLKFSKIDVAKFVISGVVGYGTHKIISKAIQNVVTPSNTFEKIAITAAAWVVTAIATEVTKNYIDEMVDDLAESVDSLVQSYKLNVKVARVTHGVSTFEQEGLDEADFTKRPNGTWVPKENAFLNEGQILTETAVRRMLDSGGWMFSLKDQIWMTKEKDKNGKRKILRPVVGKTDKWQLVTE